MTLTKLLTNLIDGLDIHKEIKVQITRRDKNDNGIAKKIVNVSYIKTIDDFRICIEEEDLEKAEWELI